MSAQIIPFTYESKSVRVVDRDGEPWFVAIDVCRILDIANVTQAIQRLDDDEVTLCKTEGSHRPTNLVNESGLYALILRSNKPQARPFRKWVTSEVLPAIRRTGGYAMAPAAPAVPALPQTFADALRLAAAQAEEIEAMQPKALAYDGFLTAEGLVCLRDAMRAVNAKPQKAIDHLKALGVLFYEGRGLTPRAYHREMGYFVVRTREVDGEIRKQTLVTPKGMDWLHKVLPDAVFTRGAA